MRIVKSMARRPSRSGSENGFTFQEVLVAMNLIVFGILGYSLATVGVMRGTSESANATIAINLAQDKIEELKAQRNPGNLDNCPAGGDQAITASGTAGGIFDRCWTINDSPLGAKLKQMVVKVSWWDHEQRAITLATLFYTD